LRARQTSKERRGHTRGGTRLVVKRQELREALGDDPAGLAAGRDAKHVLCNDPRVSARLCERKAALTSTYSPDPLSEPTRRPSMMTTCQSTGDWAAMGSVVKRGMHKASACLRIGERLLGREMRREPRDGRRPAQRVTTVTRATTRLG
jgi:hypothetical protein